MNAAEKLRKVVGIETAAEREKRISECGHQVARTVEAVQRQVGRLESTPLTIAQHWGVQPVMTGIDFPELDRLAALTEEILTPGKDVMFVMENERHSLRAWAQQLQELRVSVEPYRNKGQRA